MAKMGRPTSYDPVMCEAVYRYALLGMTQPEMARNLGISAPTLSAWLLKYPEFRNALKAGSDEADTKVAMSLYQKAIGYTRETIKVVMQDGAPVLIPVTEQVPPDTVAQIFWLKNRRRDQWRDQREQRVTGPDGGAIQVEAKRGPIDIKALSPEQREQFRGILLTLKQQEGEADEDGAGTGE